MINKGDNKAQNIEKMPTKNHNNIENLFQNKICIDCGNKINNKLHSVFGMAPGPEMIVIDCDKCQNGKYKVRKKLLDDMGVQYEMNQKLSKLYYFIHFLDIHQELCF